MKSIDLGQNKRIGLIIGIVTALSGITALLIYFEGKRHRRIAEEVTQLDKQIKELQLLKLKNGDK